MLLSILGIVQILSALVMTGLVLLQHGKGADMGASFGSGASGSLFGATGSANFLSRMTAACATVFFVSTLWLSYLGNQRVTNADAGQATALDQAATPAAAIPATAASAAVIPAPAAASATAVAASGAALIPAK